MTAPRRLSLWVVGTSLVLGGCRPDPIVWSPDSTGIIFSARGNDATPERRAVTAVHHFDVRSKALHIVVPSKGRTGTRLPAFSPDGKRVAVAQAWTWSRGQFVQVRTYRLDGTVDVASEPFRLLSVLGLVCPHVFTIDPLAGLSSPGGLPVEEKSSPRKKPFEKPHIVESSVEWSPDGRYILVDTAMGCARYDMVTKRFRQFAPSVTVGLRGLIERSVVPGGKGFVAAWNGAGWSPESQPTELLPLLKSLVLVDWEGVSRPFTASPEAERAVHRFAREAEEAFRRGGLLPLYRGRWEGRVAVVVLSGGSLVLDPGSRTINYRDDPDVQRIRTWAMRNRVGAVERFGDGETLIAARDGGIDVKVRGAAWQTLASGVNGDAEFFPSPDRRLVAVRFLTGDDVRRTMIVDPGGQLIAEFDME
jgi:hypothetical protein